MRQLTFFLLSFFSALLIFTTSCTDGDLNRPTIEIISPKNSADLTIGKPIDLEIIFTDDVGLQAYDIDIHWGEDHGDHSAGMDTKSLTSLRSSNKKETYKYKKSFQISGKKVHIKNSDIVVPEGIRSGKYHFGITCVDINGNSSVAWLNNLYIVD